MPVLELFCHLVDVNFVLCYYNFAFMALCLTFASITLEWILSIKDFILIGIETTILIRTCRLLFTFFGIRRCFESALHSFLISWLRFLLCTLYCLELQILFHLGHGWTCLFRENRGIESCLLYPFKCLRMASHALIFKEIIVLLIYFVIKRRFDLFWRK